MTGSHESAEDVVQESFLRLAHKNPLLPDRESTRRWLFVVARNLCTSKLRKRKRNPQVGYDDLRDLSVNGTPMESAVDEERAEWIRRAVMDLPVVLREVLILREYEELSYMQIAEILGCPVGTVKSRIAAARQHLQKLLRPLLEVE